MRDVQGEDVRRRTVPLRPQVDLRSFLLKNIGRRVRGLGARGAVWRAVVAGGQGKEAANEQAREQTGEETRG